MVITKLKPLDPQTVVPEIQNDEFKGVWQHSNTFIDPLYATWITHARHRVFGNLWGWPLYANVYKIWWSTMFRYALRDRHIEDRVSPPLIMRHPPGDYEDDDGTRKAFRDAALTTGKAIRAGETVAMSSERVGEDEEKASNLYKWDAKFLQGGENFDAFIKLDDADDVKMFMGLLIPPGAVLNPKGGIGSQAVAESLGHLFWDTELIRMLEMYDQCSKYILQPLNYMNFGPGPRATLVPKGFQKGDRQMVSNIFTCLANRQDLDITALIDLARLAEIVDMPISPKFGKEPLRITPQEIEGPPEWVNKANEKALKGE